MWSEVFRARSVRCAPPHRHTHAGLRSDRRLAIMRCTVLLTLVACATSFQVVPLPAARNPQLARPMARMSAEEAPRKGLWGPDREPPACC